MVTVRLFAGFQEIAGVDRVEVDESRVREMLSSIADAHPELEGEMFTSPRRSELRPRVKVLVNGRNIDFLEGLDTKIREGDRVAVFPPVGGG